ncbi:Protein phosphatase 2C 2 [Apophysomyces sp. BC1034]|nr:Protein phosphatase 2C 2 [Apophysomyces sp. BC1015]KAG0173644.1 Protein phosphatase 2C 2 [Apophysomyces sp. BC1021]KAG0185601.1 Protein phosphatase 2C 2 [Apophysomyces sp. BC1034]
MGQTLSEPITTKESEEGNSKRVMYGVSSMQGWRLHMEDAHTAIASHEKTNASFFAVFDGHGGSAVAKYSSENLYKKVFGSDAFQRGRYREALRRSYMEIDQDLRTDPQYTEETSGCTAIAALVTKNDVLFVSNAGDSRAVISTSNGRAIALSQDHKPNNQKEAERIKKAGGHVEYGRVNGSLALSRALGDLEFKQNTQLPPEKQAVTAEPDIIEHELTNSDEFVVIACDGIWDCMTNQEVVNFVRQKLGEKKLLKSICEDLMDNCLASYPEMSGIGCDNMTVVIVAFLRKKSMSEWYSWMAQKNARTDNASTNSETIEPDLKKPRVMDPSP